ncbi:hypothetical protein DB345_21210 [Spartobacteria bacterium LR76]|nr:hypothetical protein DB345_21210 [Spartobacteria bacterium LR76]
MPERHHLKEERTCPMTTPIEFAAANESTDTETSPWTQPRKSTYEDLILKTEYAERQLRFAVGQNWMRIVPALASSVHGWMLPLHVLNFEGGRFCHPRTLKRNAKSVYDHAYAWAKEHAPEGLYSKTNKSGIRLLTDPMCVFWTLIEQDGKQVARLVVASGYDGSRGGAPGLGWKIWQHCRERDETGKLIADVTGEEAGVLICVEKNQPKGAQYPSYTLRLGRQPRPMADLLAQMDAEEIASLRPLEEVARELTEEEQWACLARTMAPETVKLIRASLNR